MVGKGKRERRRGAFRGALQGAHLAAHAVEHANEAHGAGARVQELAAAHHVHVQYEPFELFGDVPV